MSDTTHMLTATPDDKYSHLAYGACSCGAWETTGAVTNHVLKHLHDKHATDK